MEIKGNCFIYTRCSTEEQSKKGFSHQYQKSSLERYLSHHSKAALIGVYQDTITGTTLDRPQLNDMFEICKSNIGHVNLILVHKWDRFGRDTEECLRHIRLFKEIGIEVNCSNEWIDFSSMDYPLILALRFSMAEVESRKISQRTKDGLNQSRRSGYYVASPPIGYKRIREKESFKGKQRKLLVQSNEALIVKEVLKKFIGGEQRGDLYKEYKDKLVISRSTFYKIFTNPVYAGRVECKAYANFPYEIVEGKHEGIISMEEYNRIQVLIQENEGGNKGKTWTIGKTENLEFYLKGSLRCTKSKRLMTGSYSKGRSKKYPYYHTPSGKERTRIKMEIAHKIVSQAIDDLSYTYTKVDVDEINAIISELKMPKEKIVANLAASIDTEVKKMERLDSLLLNEQIDPFNYKRLIVQCRMTKLKLTKQLSVEKCFLNSVPKLNNGMLESVYNLRTIYKRSIPKVKQRLLKGVFPDSFEIDVKNGRVRTAYVNKLFDVKGSKSIICEVPKQKNGTLISESPVLGERPDSNRRPSEPQTDALTN